LNCFDQASAVEMLDALKAIEPQLKSDNIPAVVNLSLGTHVGPHNGVSPVEEFISKTLISGDRFIVAAAGNEGGLGRSAKLSLAANETDFLNVHTGFLCRELLVEFWWKDFGVPGVSIEVNISEMLANGTPVDHANIQISPTTIGASLAKIPAGLPGSMVMHSLFSANCRQNFTCAALAISSTGNNLPQLQIRTKMQSPQDLIVNAWIVVSEANPLTAFVEGGREGTVMVPASDLAVLSVAGVRNTGQIWEGSSRGPAAQYDTTPCATDSPLMAHLPDLGTEFGTSFASPRACADAVSALADPIRRLNCHDAVSLLQETYGLGPLPTWNSRYGYHKQTS
jgi:hypothetical protein